MAAFPRDIPSMSAASSGDRQQGSTALRWVFVATFDRLDGSRSNQSTSVQWLVFTRMPPVEEKISAIEFVGQKFLISFDYRTRWLHATCIRHHPIFGDDCETLDLDRHARTGINVQLLAKISRLSRRQ